MKLDERDQTILRLVARNGRISKAALAEAIHLSPSAALERLRRLEKNGLIEGYGARLNQKKLGAHVTIFVTVELDRHKSADFRSFEHLVARHAEITEIWSLGGGVDYLLKVVSRDVDSYQRLIDVLLESRVGIARYTTHIVTRAVKETSAALALLADDPA